MNKLSLTLVALFVGASSAGAQGFGNIHGRVVDRVSGLGVSNAAIDLISPAGAVLTVQADSLGRFRITAVSAGVVRLRARGLGYSPATPDTIRVVRGTDVVRDFRLEPFGQVYLEQSGDVTRRRKP